MANLWTEFSAHNRYRRVKNGNGCKNSRNSLVAATFEKANTYVFAEPIIRDREVSGSNPLLSVKKELFKTIRHFSVTAQLKCLLNCSVKMSAC